MFYFVAVNKGKVDWFFLDITFNIALYYLVPDKQVNKLIPGPKSITFRFIMEQNITIQ